MRRRMCLSKSSRPSREIFPTALQKIPDLGNLRRIETFIRRVSVGHGATANRDEGDQGGSRMGNPNAAPRASGKGSARALGGLLLAIGVSSIVVSPQAAQVANVDDARIIDNAKTGKDWPSTGFDYGVNRFSPLDQVTTANVGKLGLAWSYPLDSIRGVEATPVVVDGVMYVTGPWAIVSAVNAKTGEKLWTFDPQSPRTEG